MSETQGLSDSEAAARRARGQGNAVTFRTGRTYLQILTQNVFTFINTILFAIGVALILMGQAGDALVTAGLVLLNVIASVVQEGRAKRKLDELALLARPKAIVVRDGQEKTVDPGEVVLDDLLVARPGEQIVADGVVVAAQNLELDESLLTGESDTVPKRPGDPVYSGSFCVAGEGRYTAQKVGEGSLINRLTAQAKAFRQVKTPLQRDIDRIIRVLVVLVAQLGVLLAVSYVTRGVPLVEGVRVAAVLVALVPQGLFFMTTVAYALGALRASGAGALIQQSNAVESTSHVDMLCLDKTGTLTTNRLKFEALCPLGGGAEADTDGLRRLLGDYMASSDAGNRTAEAIRAACPGQRRGVRESVAFSSEHKWSAVASDDEALRGVTVLGAPEVLWPCLEPDRIDESEVAEAAKEGLRVLLLAHRPEIAPLYDGEGNPQLPAGLAPLAVVRLSDELRPDVGQTLRQLAELGIELKIISGDNPQTVGALARQAGFRDADRVVSGLDLGMDEAKLDGALDEASIFGRITPQQKEKLVQRLRDKGHYVAMIGDGVNDVLSLKKAQVGIAMQSGSAATRGVADMVLLNDTFAAVPAAFREGQRIVKGMEDIVRLLLTRTVYVALLIVAAQIAAAPFPITPKHNSILALLTVGLPILAIAAWARPGLPPSSVVRSTGRFVLPAGFTVSLVAVGVYLFYLNTSGDLARAQTALTTVTVLCGLVLIAFVEPPTAWWAGGDELSGDWRPTLLAAALLGLFAVVSAVAPLRNFFELVPLSAADYAALAALVLGWTLFLRYAWRARLFERLLGE